MKGSEELMYYKLDDYLKRRIERVGNITSTNYELLGDFVPIESLMAMIDDLLVEYEVQVEKYEEFEKYVDDNYKFVGTQYYEYGE